MKRALTALLLGAIAMAAVVTAGCAQGLPDAGRNGTATAMDPVQVTEEYLDAIMAGDANTAFLLITAESRESTTPGELPGGSAEGLKDYRTAPTRISGNKAVVPVELTFLDPDGRFGETDIDFEAVLARESGLWRVDTIATGANMEKAFGLKQESMMPR